MPRPRTPKSRPESRNGSGEESDAAADPSSPIRRTRKRPAHPAREGSEDQSSSHAPPRPHFTGQSRSNTLADPEPAVLRLRGHERRSSDDPPTSSAFEAPNEVRDRLALLSSPIQGGNSPAESSTPRAGRSNRPALGLSQTFNQPTADSQTPLMVQTSNLPVQSSQSRSFGAALQNGLHISVDPSTSATASSSSHPANDLLSALTEAARSQNTAMPASLYSSTPLARSNSNMSPPRPTRSLPRRRASARTQNRPLLSSTNSSSQNAARSRSTSGSNVLAPSSSFNANILASGGHSRHNSLTGCAPLGGGFDPSYNPPSGMSTPRTPLAEIPLWLADMRSESSRRSSMSSTSYMDREEFMATFRAGPGASRHARTASSSSSGPPSPVLTRNGSISPVVPFRRSLRGRRPRESDENARVSPSPSYFGEYDALPPSSSASVRGDMEDFNAGLSSSTVLLGPGSPGTPSVQLQSASPAMSTRSRTLNRAGSVRTRRMTNPLNTPISVEQAAAASEVYAALRNNRTTAAQQGRGENRPVSLLERRAAAATNTTTPAAAVRVSSRPTSRTSSPARGTRAAAARRRSIAVDIAAESTALIARPAPLPSLQIPGVRVPTSNPSTPSSVMAVESQLGGQFEPPSPSAFSEMTSLTQGSTASESMASTNGMPATPNESMGNMEMFAQGDGDETMPSGSSRALRQGGLQRKNPLARQSNEEDEGLGIQLRPRQ